MTLHHWLPRRRQLFGFGLLCCTLSLWVGSSVLLQTVFRGDWHFDKPLFVTVFNGCSYTSCLLPTWLKGRCHTASLRAAFPLVIRAGVLWLTSSVLFNFSLEHTSVATNTVISSTSSAFAFVFSLSLGQERFNWYSCCAALLSLGGCSLVATQAPQNTSRALVSTTIWGDILAIFSAALFSLSGVLLRKYAPENMDMNWYMGTLGLLSITAAPLVLGMAHASGVEAFEQPTAVVLCALALNAVLGSTLANYCYNSALMVLSPVVANICLSLSIPISALTDQALLGEHRFSKLWMLGASIVASAVVVASLGLEDQGDDDDEDNDSARAGPGGFRGSKEGRFKSEGSDEDRAAKLPVKAEATAAITVATSPEDDGQDEEKARVASPRVTELQTLLGCPEAEVDEGEVEGNSTQTIEFAPRHR